MRDSVVVRVFVGYVLVLSVKGVPYYYRGRSYALPFTSDFVEGCFRIFEHYSCAFSTSVSLSSFGFICSIVPIYRNRFGELCF